MRTRHPRLLARLAICALTAGVLTPTTIAGAANAQAARATAGSPAHTISPRWTETNPGTVTNVATGRCLDSNYAGAVYTLKCNGGRYQQWVPYVETVDSRGDLMYRFRDLQTGRFLDSNTRGQVYTSPSNGGQFQWWYASVDRVGFRDWATGRNLDSNRTGTVYTLWYNGGPYQNWYY